MPFGRLPDGAMAEICRIASPSAEAAISTLGATIVELWLPDRKEKWADVVLGFDSPLDYLERPGNLGATIGRYAAALRRDVFH